MTQSLRAGAVALIIHFETMEQAVSMLAKLESAGGLSETCQGHLWDEEECAGYVLADSLSSQVLEQHISLWVEEKLEDLADYKDDPTVIAEVHALMPVHLISGEQCGGDVLDEEAEQVELRARVTQILLQDGGSSE